MAEKRNVRSDGKSAWAGSTMLRGREKPASPELCASWADSMEKLEEYVVWLEDQLVDQPGGATPNILREAAKAEGVKAP